MPYTDLQKISFQDLKQLQSKYIEIIPKYEGRRIILDVDFNRNPKFKYLKKNKKEIGVEDRIINQIWERPILFFNQIEDILLKNFNSLTDIKFHFRYYNRIDQKNSLYLTYVETSDDENIDLKYWANQLNVSSATPLFKGYLNQQQFNSIYNFIIDQLSYEKFKEDFYYKDSINKIIFHIHEDNDIKSFIINYEPNYEEDFISSEPHDYYLFLNDVSNFILNDLKQDDLYLDNDKALIDVLCAIFNLYVLKRGNHNIVKVFKNDKFKDDEFNLNVEMIPNVKTKQILFNNPNLRNNFQVFLAVFTKSNINIKSDILSNEINNNLKECRNIINQLLEITESSQLPEATNENQILTFKDFIKNEYS